MHDKQHQTTKNNNNNAINKITPTWNHITTPQDSFRKIIIDKLAETPTDTATITSVATYTTTSTTIRRNMVLTTSTKYIEVTSLTIFEVDVLSKVCN